MKRATPQTPRTAAAILLLLLLLFPGLACAQDSSPTPGPPPQDALERAAQRMAALSSLRFSLTHEKGRTPLIAGIEAQTAQGTVLLPDQASLHVEAVATTLGAFIPLELLIHGAQISMTDPFTGTPQRLSAESLPLNFLNLGVTLADIARALQGPLYTTDKTIDGVASRGIGGSLLGRDLQPLVRSAIADARVALEVWVGEDNLIRRVRIEGAVTPSDPADLVRILSFSAFDQPAIIPPLP